MSDSSLSIRPYEPADADAVVAVHEAAFRASNLEFVEGAAVDDELQDVSDSYLEGGHTFLVGAIDGAVVATGGYRHQGETVAEVGHVRVHPSHQREGYAREIMAALEARATQEGIDTFVLETHEDLVAAQGLYEDLEYELDHTEPHSVTGDEMLHYRKSLRGGRD